MAYTNPRTNQDTHIIQAWMTKGSAFYTIGPGAAPPIVSCVDPNAEWNVRVGVSALAQIISKVLFGMTTMFLGFPVSRGLEIVKL